MKTPTFIIGTHHHHIHSHHSHHHHSHQHHSQKHHSHHQYSHHQHILLCIYSFLHISVILRIFTRLAFTLTRDCTHTHTYLAMVKQLFSVTPPHSFIPLNYFFDALFVVVVVFSTFGIITQRRVHMGQKRGGIRKTKMINMKINDTG